MKIFGIRQTSTLPEILASGVGNIAIGTLLSIPVLVAAGIWGAIETPASFFCILLSGGLIMTPHLIIHEYSHAIMARIVGFTDIEVSIGDGLMSYAELRAWEHADQETKKRLLRRHILAIVAGPLSDLVLASLLTAGAILTSAPVRYYIAAGAWILFCSLILNISGASIGGHKSDIGMAIFITKKTREPANQHTK